MGCVLRCVECPPVGGDTMWANMVLAYDNLPAEIQVKIAGLRARTASRRASAPRCRSRSAWRWKAQFPDAEHPVVRTHPIRARRSCS